MTPAERVRQLGSSWPGTHHRRRDGRRRWRTLFSEAGGFERPSPARLGQPHQGLRNRAGRPGLTAGAAGDCEAQVVAANRFGIPAIATKSAINGSSHLARRPRLPTPWRGRRLESALVREDMAEAIAVGQAAVGVHQGWRRLLDVVRDYRWGGGWRGNDHGPRGSYLVSGTGARLSARTAVQRVLIADREALRRVLSLGAAGTTLRGGTGHAAYMADP